MKKWVLPLFAASPLAALAEGTTSSVDVTNATDAITQVQGAFEQILGTLGSAVLAIVIAGVAIWAIPRVVGSLKSAFTGGKGR